MISQWDSFPFERFIWILLKGFRVSAYEFFVHMRAKTLIIMNVITMRFFPSTVSFEFCWRVLVWKLELGRALKFEIRLVCQTAQLSMQIQLLKIIQYNCIITIQYKYKYNVIYNIIHLVHYICYTLPSLLDCTSLNAITILKIGRKRKC